MTDSAIYAGSLCFSPYRFTGKERDSETENDYFGARYYASTMARFMSPDWSATAEPVPYATIGNPQSLNLFAYVGNNPLIRVDADGHDYQIDASSGCFTEMEYHNMNGPNCHAVHSPTPLHGPVAGGSETDLAETEYLESGTIPWIDQQGNLETWVPGHETLPGGETPDGQYIDGHWESSGFGASELELAQAPSNDMEYDIFHCPSCVNTWKQADCVVSKPLEDAGKDIGAGVVADAFKGGVSNGAGWSGFMQGAWNGVKEGTLTAAAAFWAYGGVIYHTAKYTVAGCPNG